MDAIARSNLTPSTCQTSNKVHHDARVLEGAFVGMYAGLMLGPACGPFIPACMFGGLVVGGFIGHQTSKSRTLGTPDECRIDSFEAAKPVQK